MGAKSGEVIRYSLNYQALLTSVAVIRIACVICLCTDFSQDPVLAVLCLFPTHTTECFRFCMDSSNTSHGSAAGLLFPLQNVSLYQKKKEQKQTNQKRKQYFAVLGIYGTVAALLRLERQESWCCCWAVGSYGWITWTCTSFSLLKMKITVLQSLAWWPEISGSPWPCNGLISFQLLLLHRTPELLNML